MFKIIFYTFIFILYLLLIFYKIKSRRVKINNSIVFLIIITFIILSLIICYSLLINNIYITRIIIVFIVMISLLMLDIIIQIVIKYNELLIKYNNTLDNLSLREEELIKYRVINHENKNHLAIIRNIGNYKEVKEYIDQLLDRNDMDKEIDKLLKKVPSNQIRAVLYDKCIKMKKNNIDYSLIVSRNIKSKDMLDIPNSTMFDLINIISVFIDNAIECDVYDNHISVVMTKDDDIIIAISNKFEGNINLSDIYIVGYSTKGNNHGYGLPYVKSIISKNKNILIETEVVDNIFSQIIRIRK